MATVFKNLLGSDVAQTRTLLHEAVPITGTIVFGTTYNDENIKNYTHEMFQSVYDYPVLSASSNHIFDITYGYASSVGDSNNTQNQKKLNIYNQMAQVLVGYDINGNVRKFDQNGNHGEGDTMDECVFINYARLLTKDEFRKGQYTLDLDGLSSGDLIQDSTAADSYKVNSPAGEYGLLYTASAAAGDIVGHIYYQAGIVVLTSSVFVDNIGTLFETQGIQDTCDKVREDWVDNDFQNTTELNSTIYFCRINPNEFNYSSNPTYVNNSKIRVKQVSTDAPVSYITTVGLYSADNELVAVAKLSEPIKKTDSNALTLRVRLDY